MYTLLYSRAQCYMPSLVKLVHRFGRFLKVFTIFGHGGHLGHVTWIIYIHIGSPFQYILHIKFGFDGPVVSEEKMYEYYGNTVILPQVGADEPQGILLES